MNYLHWQEKTITDFSENNISDMYSHGFVFTRLGRGIMHQTRSIRIDLGRFDLSSENRRILKKTENMILKSYLLPLSDYDFRIGKLAKDFYDKRFGAGIMSAQKVKEMLTDAEKSNFNTLLSFTDTSVPISDDPKLNIIGYAICHTNKEILHYSYPFYDLDLSPKDMGMGMMIKAVEYAKKSELKYIYLGSLQRSSDTYKLQFSGLEWFDGDQWQIDIEMAKKIFNNSTK